VDCPVCIKSIAAFKVKPFLKEESFSGNSPAPFVGRFGYPEVNVGVLSPAYRTEEVWLYDAPRFWAQQEFTISEIVEFRAALINSSFRANVRSSNRLLEVAQETGMASKPVDLEVELQRAPVFRMSLEPYVAPIGPSAKVKRVEITSNPKIPFVVDKAVSDTDLKAGDAMLYLYSHDFDENYLTKLLSVGTLGVGSNRKLVPTRWSITATDDAIGKHLIRQIKEYSSYCDYSCYFGSYLGNYFLILTFPEIWGFELFEVYVPKNATTATRLLFTTDYELYEGRKSYAENCGGGYYAARLPVLEKLRKLKRQGSVIALRFITDEYTLPLGVFVVRESARKSLGSNAIKFSSQQLLFDYVKEFVKKKFGCDVMQLLNKSKLLKERKTQLKLTSF
jgi:hypothetical protein